MRAIQSRAIKSKGFTLIELMVGIVLSLIVVGAASYMYLGSSKTKRSNDAQAQTGEIGRQAMDFVTRELTMAWSNPGVAQEFKTALDTRKQSENTWASALINISNGSQPPAAGFVGGRALGLFGCSNGTTPLVSITNVWTAPTCTVGATFNSSDSFVVSYFYPNWDSTTSTAAQRRGIGVDCLRQSITGAGDALNVGRVDTEGNTGQAVNIISVESTVVNVDGQSVTVGALGCRGNGNPWVFQPIFTGIEDMTIRYLVGNFDANGTLVIDPVAASGQYQTATQVSASTSLKEIVPNARRLFITFSPWRKVVAAEVCIEVKTPARNISATALTPAYVNCKGVSVAAAANNGYIRGVIRSTVALRNRNSSFGEI
jgi:type IV pilus assembly protein PilW